MKATFEISREDFTNIIITALEGGSNYWYFLDEINFPDGTPENKHLVEKIAWSLYNNQDWEGFPVYDVEEVETLTNLGEPIGKISHASCQKAFELMFRDYGEALGHIISEEYDAGDADIFFQLACLGDVVYG